MEAKTPPVAAEAPDPTRIPRIALRVTALGALAFSAATVAEYFVPSATFCQPGGGCDEVRHWSFGQSIGGLPLGIVLPLLGVLGFTALFAGSLVRDRTTSRVVGALAVVGSLIAAALLVTQATTIGSWCWLCVGVDSFAILAGLSGIAVLATSARAEPVERGSLLSPWWALWVVFAFGPLAWSGTSDADIPPAIRDLYQPGAVNVVELADFQCPFCRGLNPVLESVLSEVQGHPVNFVRIMVPLPFHLHARDAAKGYLCAERMEHGDAMADALFSAPVDDLTPPGITAIATRLGMDGPAFERCLDDPAIEARIVHDEELAKEQTPFEGLPTVYIGDRVLLGFDAAEGATPYREAVEAELAGEGTRIRVWPLATVALVAIAVFLLARRKSKR